MTIASKLRRFASGSALAALAFVAPAGAEDFEVPIHHTEVLDTGIKPKIGDTVTFSNHADIAHNLYLTFDDGTMETLDTQPPRTTKRAKLEKSGRVIVRCWIHPIIRMEFDVAPN